MKKVSHVVPLVGTWIEIPTDFTLPLSVTSFPLWERGLKYALPRSPDIRSEVVPLVGTWIEIVYIFLELLIFVVVPLVGTWIEIIPPKILAAMVRVVPLVGTWIEIDTAVVICHNIPSFPLWERGLKFPGDWDNWYPNPDKPEKILQFLHISSTIKKNVGGCVHVTYR